MRTGFLKRTSILIIAGLISTSSLAVPQPTERQAALNGVWELTSPGESKLLDASGKTPPLNAEGKALYQERSALLSKGDTSFDKSKMCKPIGFPRVLWDGSPFDIQVQNRLVFFGYTFNRNHRMVNFEEGAPVPQIPRYYGTSTAQWDGDTLVVQSAMFNTNSILDAAGLPFSEDMMIRETYRPYNGGQNLEVSLEITDPTYYTKPWEVTVDFRKVENGRILEDVCQEHSDFYRDLL